MKTTLLISRELNDDKKILEKNICKIDSFIKECVSENTVFHMGSTLTGEFRRRMESLDYRFVLKKQYRSGLEKSNKEMIRESDRVLIINFNKSPNMTDFEEYAKEQDAIHESVYVLSLYSNTDMYYKNIEFFSIKDIAGWELQEIQNSQKSICGIPSYQRGLVWKTKQVELLWDSMLRSFPIGSILVSKKGDGKTQQRGGTSNINTVNHHIIDGQQRSHNIALGFYNPFKQEHQSVDLSYLWIDVGYMKNQSTRLHLLRLLTPAHPWGYEANEEASRLEYYLIQEHLENLNCLVENTGAKDTRLLSKLKKLRFTTKLKVLTMRDFQYHWIKFCKKSTKRLNTYESFPSDSTYPIPMAWLLEFGYSQHTNKDASALKSFIQKKESELTLENNFVNALRHRWEKNKRKLNQNDTYLKKLVENIKELCNEVIVPIIHVGDKDIESLEVLFQRVNQLGTNLEGIELKYSLIKAHWGDIVENLEKAAKKAAIHPAYLCINVFRLLDQKEKEYLNEPNISSIRKKARDIHFQEKINEYIISSSGDIVLYKNIEMINLLTTTSYQDSNFKLPPVLQTYLARDSRDVYFWLLYVAKSSPEVFKDDKLLKKILGIVTTIDFFGVDKDVAVRRLFEYFSNKDMSIASSYESVVTYLSEKISKKQGIAHIYSPDQLEELFTLDNLDNYTDLNIKINTTGNYSALKHGLWNYIEYTINERQDEKYKYDDVWQFLAKFVKSRKILVYAQRKYVLDQFKDYDAFSSFWIEKNRPWDYDHLLPSKILSGKWHSDYCYKGIADQWSNTIGNLRLLHFSDNRSRQTNFLQFADENSNFLIDRKSCHDFNFKENDFKTTNEDAYKNTKYFVAAVNKRLLRIYREWWDTLEIEQLVAKKKIN